ncbi:MAG: CHRD domain-containing protein [Chloroflexi bacterium]|nr:CHRD domain-containing protein [Chloroflexota bacterium]
MKRSRTLLLALTISLLVVLLMSTTVSGAGRRSFRAILTGAGEVPPVDTDAIGKAIFHLNKDDSALRYRLVVGKIENIVQAHIHCGAEGVNGPVVAFLFGPVPGGVTVSGILAEGTITNAQIIPREPSDACPDGVANFAELLERINSGQAYVNVHTTANPGGEIRGPMQ